MNSSPIVCFGAGNLGRRVARAVHPVLFCDNNSSLRGTKVDSIPIDPPKAAVALHSDATFVVTMLHPSRDETMSDRMNQLKSLGASNAIPFWSLFAKYRDLLPNLLGTSELLRGA